MYDLIYADPPWKFRSNSKKKPGRNVMKEYPTMSVEDIAALDVGSIAKKDSMLIMWITTPMMDRFNDVMKSWGFKFKGNILAWVKLNKDNSVFRGLGYTTRKNLELCVYGTKGKGLGRPQIKNLSEIIEMEDTEDEILTTPRAGLAHSEKPVEAYERIETLYPNAKKIELFARSQRHGWDSWGLEVESTIKIATNRSIVNTLEIPSQKNITKFFPIK